jgi:hypothetical protein
MPTLPRPTTSVIPFLCNHPPLQHQPHCHPHSSFPHPNPLPRCRSHPSLLNLLSTSSRASDGRVAQLGERLVRNEEAEGSNPFSSTTNLRNYYRLGNMPYNMKFAVFAN